MSVTPKMLAAGRAAFLKNRKQLDDLYDYFPTDLADFLKAIYAAMDEAAGTAAEVGLHKNLIDTAQLIAPLRA